MLNALNTSWTSMTSSMTSNMTSMTSMTAVECPCSNPGLIHSWSIHRLGTLEAGSFGFQEQRRLGVSFTSLVWHEVAERKSWQPNVWNPQHITAFLSSICFVDSMTSKVRKRWLLSPWNWWLMKNSVADALCKRIKRSSKVYEEKFEIQQHWPKVVRCVPTVVIFAKHSLKQQTLGLFFSKALDRDWHMATMLSALARQNLKVKMPKSIKMAKVKAGGLALHLLISKSVWHNNQSQKCVWRQNIWIHATKRINACLGYT